MSYQTSSILNCSASLKFLVFIFSKKSRASSFLDCQVIFFSLQAKFVFPFVSTVLYGVLCSNLYSNYPAPWLSMWLFVCQQHKITTLMAATLLPSVSPDNFLFCSRHMLLLSASIHSKWSGPCFLHLAVSDIFFRIFNFRRLAEIEEIFRG